jgi:hypothetical protein
MTDDDARFALVEKCRAAQKRYFRDRDNLQECKGLERLVDQMLAARHAGPTLFDDAPEEGDPS